MKEKIKRIKPIYKFYVFLKDHSAARDFSRDKKFFLKHYIHGGEYTTTKAEYEIMLAIHQLEKGLTSSKLRPFGVAKVDRIIEILKSNREILASDNYVGRYALNILRVYMRVYEESGWTENSEYKRVKEFCDGSRNVQEMACGSESYIFDNVRKQANIDYFKFLTSRHSVRNFSDRILQAEDLHKATEMALCSPSACNRQMCKIYYVKNAKSKEVVRKHAQGLSLFDTEHINFLVITFDTSASLFIGERNQGWLNAGLFSMNLVNGLHSLGIGSCFIQFGNSFADEQQMKRELGIPENERIAVLIAAGYYAESSRVPCSTRKSVADVYREI